MVVNTDNATAELVTSNTCSLSLLCVETSLEGDGLRVPVVVFELVKVEVSRVNEPALRREVGIVVVVVVVVVGGGNQGLTCTRFGDEER